jgi:hypothetical protein
MAIAITVKHRDGSESKTKVWASTEVAFEEKFGIAWTEAFTENHPKQTYLYFAAYHSIHEAGNTGLSFEMWMRNVDEVQPLIADTPFSDQVAPHGSSELSQ